MYVWGTLDFDNDGDRKASAECPLVGYPTRMPNLPSGAPPTSAGCGLKHAVMIYEGTLFGWGSNASNQLGPSVFQKAESVTKLTAFAKTCESTPVQVACGAKHTLVRTIDGQVWSVGENSFGQLGHKSHQKHWARVSFADPVENVAAGGETSFALSAGRLYSWGSVRHGSLGHGSKGEVEMVRSGAQEYVDVEKPKLVQWFVGQRIQILEVAAGKAHMLARSDTDVYCVGQGSFGKLGQGNTAEHLVPKRVSFPERKYVEKLIQVAAGHDHSVVLKHSSEFGSVLYVWGRIDSDTDGNLFPKLITEAGSLVTSIYASKFFTMAVSSDGSLQVWGKCQGCPPMGVAEGIRKRWPTHVGALEGKTVIGAMGSSCMMIAFAEDSKLSIDEPLDVVVPLDYRNPTYPYDIASKAFFCRVMGKEEGTAYFDRVPPAPALEESGIKYRKMGTKTLHKGSRVRVWMTDVYALGKIARRDIEGLSKYHFELDWAREDWDPEIIELHSDDEDLDEANENRWQHLWFLQLPDGCQDNQELRFKNAQRGTAAKELIDDDE